MPVYDLCMLSNREKKWREGEKKKRKKGKKARLDDGRSKFQSHQRVSPRMNAGDRFLADHCMDPVFIARFDRVRVRRKGEI